MVKCLFVWKAHDHESMAIEYLSAVLKRAGHETALILFSDYEEENAIHNRLTEKMNNFKPDYVCFSVMTDDYSWACDLSKYIKKAGDVPIIFGGVHVTSCPEETIKNDFVNYIVLGEAEEAIVELVENPNQIDIKNVWFKKDGTIIKNKLRPLIKDLDTLPFPDKELFYKEAPYLRGEIYYCMSGRGCPFGCSYCFNNYYKKLYVGDQWLRKRSVESVIRELKIAKEKFGFHLVHFGDDCFTYDVKWLDNFLREYKKEINIPFKILAHPHFINEEIVSILKKGGCLKIAIGAQTPVERVRKDICKRTDTDELIKKAVASIKGHGIFLQLDHIHGLPTQTKQEFRDGINFYIDLKPDVIAGYWLMYYPKCDITKFAEEQGEIDKEFVDSTFKGKVGYSGVIQNLKKDKEIAAISRFFYWIPFLPRPISRYILKKRAYMIIFKSDIINGIPLFIRHLRSFKLMRIVLKSVVRRNKLKNHYLKLNQKYK